MVSTDISTCTEVTARCSIAVSHYGYAPNMGGNVFLLIIFLLCAVGQAILLVRYPSWRSYGILVLIGTAAEALGYVGRAMMSENVWNKAGFMMQSILLIIAPSFLAAALYLTLKGLVIHFGEEFSFVKPVWWTRAFVGLDIVGFLTQVTGGGIAASSDDDPDKATLGNTIMLIGVAVQAGTMGVAGVLAADFGRKVVRAKGTGVVKREGRGFQLYLVAMAIAFVAILIRCIFRIPEMAEGWGKGLMREEIPFMIFEGSMIALASILQTVAFPGIFARSTRPSRGDEQMKLESRDSSAGLHMRQGV